MAISKSRTRQWATEDNRSRREQEKRERRNRQQRRQEKDSVLGRRECSERD
jgi:hypothetical protein